MIIVNEKKYAEQCLLHGLPTSRKKTIYALSIIARYFYHCKGLRGKRIVTELEKCLERNNNVLWRELLEKLARTAGKQPLCEIDGVWITANELATIESLHDKVLERLAFTVLCIAKLNNRRKPNNDNWVNTNRNEVFKTARIFDSVAKSNSRIGMLYYKELLRLPNFPRTSYRVEFVDDDSENKLFISDFRELGYEYRKYKGENFIRCKKCGILVKGNKNGTKKYCAGCASPPHENRIVSCVDCGCLFWLHSQNKRSTRCSKCQKEHSRLLARARKQKQRLAQDKNEC